MKIGFISLGCSKNQVDSEKMMGMLVEGGHQLVANPSLAEAIIINTCGFIEPAKEEAINTILEMAEYKQQNCKKLIVVGCLAQRYKADLIHELPEVDRIISIAEYPHLNEILTEELGNSLSVYGKSERLMTQNPWTAYLKIAEGCSNCCSYCAIPLIRGDNKTIPMEELVEEATQLASQGVKELVVIAQDSTKYGIDLYNDYKLLELLQKLQVIEGLHWIRILYMYPDEISFELIEGMAKLSKVLPYFDIPMQHASSKMLKLMNRRGDANSVKQLIEKIKTTYAYPTLRTTFIVGFPYEEEADFKELVDFISEVHWNKMGAFTYSIEEDTPAYDFPQTVSEELKQQRLDELMSIQTGISLKCNQALIGETLEVLVEGRDALTRKYKGRSAHNAPDDVDGQVIFSSSHLLELGSFVQVKIVDCDTYDLFGEVC